MYFAAKFLRLIYTPTKKYFLSINPFKPELCILFDIGSADVYRIGSKQLEPNWFLFCLESSTKPKAIKVELTNKFTEAF